MPCVICKQPVGSGEQILFPPFTPNDADPIYEFSDGVAHKACFAASEKRDEVIAVLDRLAAMRTDKICHICGLKILSPDEYFALFLLTHDRENLLWPWNFTKFHRACLKNWEQARVVLTQMREELRLGRWRGAAMEKLIRQLEEAANEPASA